MIENNSLLWMNKHDIITNNQSLNAYCQEKKHILRPGRIGGESRVAAPLCVRLSQYSLPSIGMLKRAEK